MEIGIGLCEGGIAKRDEPFDVPPSYGFRVGVHEDREIEVVADKGADTPSLKDVETLEDQDVGPVDPPGLALEHVVGEVGVDRDLEVVGSSLGPGDEFEESSAVVALGEAFSVHQPSLLQHRVGIEETVGGHQLDTRVLRPSGEELLENSGDRRLPHRHRTGDPDQEGSGPRRGTEECVGDGRQLMAALDVKVEETREGEETVLDHVDVEIDIDSPDLLEIRLGQGQWGVGPERGPFITGEIEVGRLAQQRSG